MEVKVPGDNCKTFNLMPHLTHCAKCWAMLVYAMVAITRTRKILYLWMILCIKQVEWQEYTPPGTDIPKRKCANVYYHFDRCCITFFGLKQNSFIPSGLQIPEIIKPQLVEINSSDFCKLN